MKVNTSLETGRTAAEIELKRLIDKGVVVELKEIKQTRSTRQNAALHLFFTHVAEALNDSGIYFKSKKVLCDEYIEIPWDLEMVKKHIWKEIQKNMFNTEKTSRLKTNQINPIFDVICFHIGNLGIEVSFPNNFDYYLESVNYG